MFKKIGVWVEGLKKTGVRVGLKGLKKLESESEILGTDSAALVLECPRIWQD